LSIIKLHLSIAEQTNLLQLLAGIVAAIENIWQVDIGKINVIIDENIAVKKLPRQ